MRERFHQRIFNALHSRSLLYNACWEDPDLDRVALDLRPGQTVAVITSAGCNALDYALCGAEVHAVDVNPRQNALLDLKLAAIRRLSHDDGFRLFGEGWHPDFRDLYRDALRPDLSPWAQGWWDRHIGMFSGRGLRQSFYDHGLSGLVARGMRAWIGADRSRRRAIETLLDAPDIHEQRAVWETRVEPALWAGFLPWLVRRQATMSLLGVPTAQTAEVERAHPDGVAGFILSSLRRVFTTLPIASNYFWTVYLRGRYTRANCPRYLTREGWNRLQRGPAGRVRTHTATMTGFLAAHPRPIDRFVLLDHQDWLGAHHPEALDEEWSRILDRAAPGARAIWRSAHPEPAWLGGIRVGGAPLAERLRFHRDLARDLHPRDRVGTYGGFHIASVA
ncbi:MAG: hypothetical protein RLZZ127_3183 [Planctomycetota bacterium]|jgi:S-adenosylmethionine-diacylglycerol 3-amino-3-carboxypropyl transferase